MGYNTEERRYVITSSIVVALMTPVAGEIVHPGTHNYRVGLLEVLLSLTRM